MFKGLKSELFRTNPYHDMYPISSKLTEIMSKSGVFYISQSTKKQILNIFWSMYFYFLPRKIIFKTQFQVRSGSIYFSDESKDPDTDPDPYQYDIMQEH